ncbi:hypothetical protein V5F89_08630 [Pelagerythrobacter marensis]|uniref:Aminotransferase class V domain-containing protein n=1 Tax=Pelagerythrobacter marensis TaxID=543877 RepID=A0ABZ2D525_9SPHN
MPISTSNLSPDFAADDRTHDLIALLAGGGDERLVLDPETGLNRYMSGPYPRDVLAYASSTANDISPAAFRYLLDRPEVGPAGYAGALDALRRRLRAVFALEKDVGIVFAPSGTDLEYVALAATIGRAPGGVHNVLLGADEVGRGCIHSAAGNFFASRTPLDRTVEAGESVRGLEAVSLSDIPVRCGEGHARSSREIAAAIDREVEWARADERHALVHVVHGSKTGLILPRLAELDRLRARWGDAMTVVVDACQVRLAPGDVAAYLDRGAIVLMTGSKFIGGVPFSGFALVSAAHIRAAPPLPTGFDALFRRAEWPENWPGRQALADDANPGLLARLDGAVFELERFRALPAAAIAAVVDTFQRVLAQELIVPLGLREVETSAEDGASVAADNVDLLKTLVTLDVSMLPSARTFDRAVALHARLARAGIRLGQPVKSVRLPGGEWGGTLRVGLSMPQIAALAAVEPPIRERSLAEPFGTVAAALRQQDVVDA